MEKLRKKLNALNKLMYLRDRKAKQIEGIRESKFYSIFGKGEEQELDLRKASLELQRIEIKLNIKLKEFGNETV